jgi:hypothetical protein
MGSVPETRMCPHCGEMNEISLSLCRNCQSPMTAYAGDLRGQDHPAAEQRARKIDSLQRVPPGAMVAAGFDVLFAVAWPLRAVVQTFMARPTVNSEGTNYIGAAIGSVGSIFTAIVLIPIGIALIVLGWFTYTQRQWAWSANVAAAILFLLLGFWHYSGLSYISLIIGGAVLFFLYTPVTRRWFGQYI